METDRELLELAAKAAGVKFHAELGDWRHEDWCRYWSDADFCTCGGAWNPLTDDGDALRLAVKLGMRLHTAYATAAIAVTTDGGDSQQHGDDPYAATRRAIVRAAAEVAKGAMTHDEFVLMFPDRFDPEEVERATTATKEPKP